jgi:hypothetical protein
MDPKCTKSTASVAIKRSYGVIEPETTLKVIKGHEFGK